MDKTRKTLKSLFDFQRFEGDSKLQGVIDDTMSTASTIRKLSDDSLENVAGGAGRNQYSDAELAKAGVRIKDVNGKKTYQAVLSSGQTINVSENVALDMCDVYKLSGGTRMTDQQLKDLIQQS